MVEKDLHEVPLISLSHQARHQLSCLLNTPKVLLSDGAEKLPRYWKGLACLLGISTEEALSYEKNQTDRVLSYWIGKNDGTATVGQLLVYLQRIDRYDVFDDLIELDRNGALINNVNQNHNNQVAVCFPNNQVVPVTGAGDETSGGLITFDDVIHGAPQKYDAYVLYADEDREFVNNLLLKLRGKNLKICTEEDLLPGFSTTFAPVANLIGSHRVNKIILIYSPEFLESPANTFYMNYAQAVGIEMRRPKIVPVMLRNCVVPAQMQFYHKLFVESEGRPAYNFYERLALSLKVTYYQANGSSASSSSSRSAMNITEMPNSSDQGLLTANSNGMLALPSGSASHGTNENDVNGFTGAMLNGSVAHDQLLTSGKSKRKKSKFRKLFKFIVRSPSS